MAETCHGAVSSESVHAGTGHSPVACRDAQTDVLDLTAINTSHALLPTRFGGKKSAALTYPVVVHHIRCRHITETGA